MARHFICECFCVRVIDSASLYLDPKLMNHTPKPCASLFVYIIS